MGSNETIEREQQSAPEQTAVDKLLSDQSSRKKFMKVLGGTAAAGGASFILAACGSDSKSGTAAATAAAGSAGSNNDLSIVNYALTLEYLESAFYQDVIDSGVLKGAEQELAKTFGADEAAHVKALEMTAKNLGTPAAKPKTKFPIESRDQVLKLAGVVENLGAAAYLGQAARITSPEVLAAALSIHTVEARHASALNTVLGKNITPDGPFAVPADMATVLKAVKPFIVSN